MKTIFITSLLLIGIFQTYSSGQSKQSLGDMIILESVYLRNLGNFSQVWSEAAGVYLGYGIFFPDHNQLIFRTGYIKQLLRDNKNFAGSLNLVPLHIGGRYYFNDDNILPFLQFMNGFNIIFENLNLLGEKSDRTLVRYFWQIGAGTAISLFDNFKVDLSINYNSSFYENNKELFYEAGAMMTGFEYNIGISWKIPDK